MSEPLFVKSSFVVINSPEILGYVFPQMSHMPVSGNPHNKEQEHSWGIIIACVKLAKDSAEQAGR